MLIAISGIDGSGKSTLENFVAAWLQEDHRKTLITSQPTPLYRSDARIRAYLDHGEDSFGMFGMALFAAADRQFHVRTVLRPALARGEHVVCNRYIADNLAWFMARGVNRPLLESLLHDIPRPDVTLLLDLPPELARERVQRRDGPRLKFEETKLAMMQNVRNHLLAVADDSFLVLDARESIAGIQQRVRARLADEAEKNEPARPAFD